MNKKFEGFFQNYGMEIQGNQAYGTMNGFEASANVQVINNSTPLSMHIAFYATEETKRIISNEIRELKIKHLTFSTDSFGISLGLSDLTINRLIARLSDVLNQITEVLKKNNVVGSGYCPVCGDALEIENSKKYNIDGVLITLDSKCVENLNATIQAENQDFKEAPNHYALGFVGAVLGAIVGVISYIILFFIGYISAISSIISILLGAFLYKKLGGKPNKVMIVIVSTVSIASMLLVVFALYLLAAIGLAPEYGYTSTGFNAFLDMMNESDFSSEFIANFAMTILFSAIGVGAEIFNLFRSIRRQKEIK